MGNFLLAVYELTAAVTGRLRRVERGASVAEYLLLAALIVVTIVAALLLFGPQLSVLFQEWAIGIS